MSALATTEERAAAAQRDALLAKLAARAPRILELDRYYDGDHPLPEAPKGAQEEYRLLLRRSRSNWMALVVDAVAERLHVVGFRFGDGPGGDEAAWALWQRNGLDADHGLVQTDALSRGYGYALVDPFDGTITAEDALECIVAYGAGQRRGRASGLKAWVDGKQTKATLYLPDAIWKWQRRSGGGRWEPRQEPDDDGAVIDNPLGVVPLVEFRANRRTRGGGRSELEGVTDIQDRINETLFSRMMAAKFAAFRQRWVTGMEIPTDPVTGQPVEPFRAAVDRLWMSSDPEVRFGEFSESDLKGYIAGVEADIQHLAAITRTPPHYLLGQSGAFPSGESLKSTETGLVAKVQRHQLQLGECWEEVIRLGLQAVGDQRAADAQAQQAEVIWKDPESRTEGELVDALVKMATLGVPQEVLWERWGASPQEISRWQTMQARSRFLMPAATPPAGGAAGAGGV